MFDVAPEWVPLLVATLFFVGLAPSLPRRSGWGRGAIAGATLLLLLRYVWWRWDATVRPLEADWGAEFVWSWTYFLAELALAVESLLFFLLMSRTVDRKDDADAHEAWVRAQPAAALPTVDVFIPTYNEGWDVLERTIVAACVLDYPNFGVHVLDDGARPWLAERCAELGVRYHVRPDRRHAKAGNINHALTVTDGDLVLVLDADFIPQRDFLARTVGFFRDPSLGVVQVPHHFFNSDPLQANLGLHQRYSDDQEFFFRDIMPARDAWGVAFSCGSNSLTRRAALDAIGGGIPTSSITEDILSSIVLLQKGWRTIYLNQRLARGLAPEGLPAMYTQRARWARGGIQTMLIPEGPVRARGLTPLQRLFFLPIPWITANLCLPLVCLGPLLFMWGGLMPVREATGPDLIAYQLPMLLATLCATPLLSRVQRNPLIACAYQLFLSFRLAPAVLHAMVRPFAVGFQVTPKGKDAQRVQADVRAVVISVGVIALTVAGIVVNELPAYQRVPADYFVTPSVLWGGVSIAVMLICLMMAYEMPRFRQDERFVVDEAHDATLFPAPPAPDAEGEDAAARPVTRGAVTVLDLSISGGGLRGVPDARPGDRMVLHLAGVGDLACRVVRRIGKDGAGVVFDALEGAPRWYLIAKVFAHGYENHGRHVRQAGALRALWVRLTGIGTAGTVRDGEAVRAPKRPPLLPRLDVPPEAAYPRLAAAARALEAGTTEVRVEVARRAA
ncbi:glycosyltransferase [Roseisolibacter sp. H3M3-2]|uniref:glycosyltransferase family 2 protein n=1 Tax=Roseisolibacter sp. H3M3-2 TaxID=3031323 RepID=UPI0023DAD1D9|nr:glycosyltransferase [Roseisolibacter sp. H3M3-2]MDF1502207.1 glycosyltransferase [Roseisolibacter sp. H3M3-2]